MPAKPWTPYANGLAAIAIMLRQTAAPAPFPDLAGAFEWIARRSFLDGISADLECRRIASLAATGRPGGYRQRLGADDLRWELILRCECAQAFCRGKLGHRHDFDWRQEPENVYRQLLIEFWRSEALRWARKSFGAPGYTGARTTEQHVHRMLKTLRRTDPSAN